MVPSNTYRKNKNGYEIQMSKQDLLIFIPTYNERDNIAEIIHRINALSTPADILCIDDNSPDGTGELLDELAAQHPGMFVVHRPFKQGIGSAHLEALDFAYQHHYRQLITMDADLTHAPEDIHFLCKHSTKNDLVIGSRFLTGSADARNGKERWLSRLSHWATNWFLTLPYDVTNAYRLYCIDKIDPMLFSRIRSHGYAFFFESVLVLHQNDISIKEIPVHLVERGSGQSKRLLRDTMEWLQVLLLLRLRKFFKQSFV